MLQLLCSVFKVHIVLFNNTSVALQHFPSISKGLWICIQILNSYHQSYIHSSILLNYLYLPWWAQMDSNHRPHAYQACALTAWAMSPSLWWRWGGSNSWPPACKAGALPAELHPHLLYYQSDFLRLEKYETILQNCEVFPMNSVSIFIEIRRIEYQFFVFQRDTSCLFWTIENQTILSCLTPLSP